MIIEVCLQPNRKPKQRYFWFKVTKVGEADENTPKSAHHLCFFGDSVLAEVETELPGIKKFFVWTAKQYLPQQREGYIPCAYRLNGDFMEKNTHTNDDVNGDYLACSAVHTVTQNRLKVSHLDFYGVDLKTVWDGTFYAQDINLGFAMLRQRGRVGLEWLLKGQQPLEKLLKGLELQLCLELEHCQPNTQEEMVAMFDYVLVESMRKILPEWVYTLPWNRDYRQYLQENPWIEEGDRIGVEMNKVLDCPYETETEKAAAWQILRERMDKNQAVMQACHDRDRAKRREAEQKKWAAWRRERVLTDVHALMLTEGFSREVEQIIYDHKNS